MERGYAPQKNVEILRENNVLWCILMYYFRASVRKAAGLRVQGRGIIPGIFLKF